MRVLVGLTCQDKEKKPDWGELKQHKESTEAAAEEPAAEEQEEEEEEEEEEE